jgi:LTXXQ motif family protein
MSGVQYMHRISRLSAAGLLVLGLAALVSVAQARMGGRHMGGGGALLGLCGSAATISNGVITIEVMVKPTPDQQAALNELKSIAKQNADALAIACRGAYSGTLPERLAASERRLEAALAGNRKLKPAAEKFYAMLSDEQKNEANGHIIFP